MKKILVLMLLMSLFSESVRGAEPKSLDDYILKAVSDACRAHWKIQNTPGFGDYGYDNCVDEGMTNHPNSISWINTAYKDGIKAYNANVQLNSEKPALKVSTPAKDEVIAIGENGCKKTLHSDGSFDLAGCNSIEREKEIREFQAQQITKSKQEPVVKGVTAAGKAATPAVAPAATPPAVAGTKAGTPAEKQLSSTATKSKQDVLAAEMDGGTEVAGITPSHQKALDAPKQGEEQIRKACGDKGGQINGNVISCSVGSKGAEAPAAAIAKNGNEKQEAKADNAQLEKTRANNELADKQLLEKYHAEKAKKNEKQEAKADNAQLEKTRANNKLADTQLLEKHHAEKAKENEKQEAKADNAQLEKTRTNNKLADTQLLEKHHAEKAAADAAAAKKPTYLTPVELSALSDDCKARGGSVDNTGACSVDTAAAQAQAKSHEEKRTCTEDADESTELPLCPKTKVTEQQKCEKPDAGGKCPDKVAGADKKPTCDKDNKPDGCEPAKSDAKPKIASSIPDEETYCLCGQYNEQTKSCTGSAQAPETKQQRKARRAAKASGNSNAKDWAGSPAFKRCVSETEGKIVDFGAFKTQKSWQEVLCADPENKAMTGADFHDEIAEHRECAMAFYILKQAQRDSSDTEQLQPVVADAKGDPYKCKSQGLETIDYDDCVAFGGHVQAAEIAKKVATEVQSAKYAMDMQDEQLKASKSPDQATAALTSQKTSFELQQQMMNQQAIVDGGTAALLGNDKANMPNFETLQTWCQSIQNSPLSGNDLGIDTNSCTQMIGAPAKFAFLQNQSANGAMTKKLVEVGAAAAIDLLKANMLGKQASQIGNAIATIKGITPLAPTGPTMADMQAELCQLAPTDPTCLGGLTRTFGTFGANDTIDFGAGGQGTIYSPSTLNPDATTGGGGGSALPTTLAKGSFGTNTTTANNPGGLKDVAAAAQFDNKGGAGNGGGGGGGAASGGGGGGGGGPIGGGSGGGVQSAIAGKAPGYGGGAGFSMMGGFGIKNGGKTADTGNPFGKMFDKGPKGDMNFRAPASAMGNKNDNIFEMITKRYNNVSTDKRLIEYEQPK